MKWFDYAAPSTLGEAVRLVSTHSRALPMAGGTDLLVQLRAGVRQADLVVDVKKIPELNELAFDPASGLKLGAAVPCCRIYGDADVRRAYPALAEVAALIGGVQIQSRASIGGNLCNASPSADSIPVLIALGAMCRVAGPAGERQVPVEEFCTAPGCNVLQPGELLAGFSLPAPKPHTGARYLRFTPRNEMDIAVTGAGVWVELENGSFRSARLALAAVAPTPLFVRKLGEWLPGKPVSPETIQAAAHMAGEAAQPITDMRGTAEFRRHLCAVLTRRALEAAIDRAREGN